MKRPCLFFVILLSLEHIVFAQERAVEVEPIKIVKQTPSLSSCVFASILNALVFGSQSLQSVYGRIPGRAASDKFSTLVKHYGARDSIVKPASKNYVEGVGMYDEDILATFNALLSDYKAPKLNGISAERLRGETSFSYLRRIHRELAGSLSKKIPVIASVEAYAGHEYKEYPDLKWKGGYSHTILITSVPSVLESYQKGFAFTFVDSLQGAIEQGYVYTEDAREFQAGRQKNSNFEWMSGSPFLLLVLPSLGLATEREESTVRTVITLSYIIGRFSESSK